MNAYVDPDLCIGCTQCAGLCPAVFQMEGTTFFNQVCAFTAQTVRK